MVKAHKTALITGGAGFIGSALVRKILSSTDWRVVNLDKLTYAGNLESLEDVASHSRYQFEQADIANSKEVKNIFERYRPDYVFHLAAESHVDRSIEFAADFIRTNILGTYVMLEEARRQWSPNRNSSFRFLYVSTDEVFGSLGDQGFFEESSHYSPRSPYSASKASGDHLVKAWYHTYQLPTLITNCSNNFGPYQFPEKLIPVVILNAISEKQIPVYGQGQNVRDWIYVEDHVDALLEVIQRGRVGETYLVGSRSEKKNIEIVKNICSLLDEMGPRLKATKQYADLITFVQDRPGHDHRYAIDPSKIETELGWRPKNSFEINLRKTVKWYLDNQKWCENISSGGYLERRGLLKDVAL